jgi:eukaryotic-like serine/threonine-protein kinase
LSLSPETKHGAYEIVAPRGAGGMGEVYREVAVKVLSESLARDPGALARFEWEAKAVAPAHRSRSLPQPFRDGERPVSSSEGLWPCR